MDSGAHFHRCDLQFHTPRDPQWAGPHHTEDEARNDYAARFVRQCREKGLDAVAITDHHDVAFFPYIKEAARSEVEDDGTPIPVSEQLTVFPGMELTLGVPCQALLILDADFDENLLTQLYGVLAITPTPPEEAHLPPTVVRLDHVTTLSQLQQELDRHEFLKGRYIVLPNVSDGGNATLLRSGNHGKYREMPCNGGYVDRSIEDLGTGNRDIIEGRNRDYGFKSIGVFQTSDNRREDGTDLGTFSMWVKWAVPTAEALRQACLARQTRLSDREPELPTALIQSVKVSNSRFMGPVDLDLNPQFNCLIGGRGTGKSTILEYLRWGVCDQPPALLGDSELPDVQAKRAHLITNTLVPYEGIVTVTFTVNNVRHVVRRHSDSGELYLKIGDREFESCREDDIRDLLPVQAYSQKQLSDVGVRADELIRFIEAPVKQQLRELGAKTDDLHTQIRSSYGVMQRKRQLEREMNQQRLEVESLTKQIEALRAELSGLSEADRETLARHDRLLREEQTLEGWKREQSRASELVRNVSRELSELPSPVLDWDSFDDKDILKEIEQNTQEMFRKAKEQVDAALHILEGAGESAEKIAELRRKWKAGYEKHLAEHVAVKERASIHETKLKQIEAAEKRIKELQAVVAQKRESMKALGEPETEYQMARGEWIDIYRDRGDLLEQKCAELTELSSGAIRATVRRGAGIEKALKRLKGLLVGTNVRGKKAEDLFDRIATHDNPVEEWNKVLAELEALAMSVRSDEDSFDAPDTPILSQYYNNGDLERVARKITEEDWIDLSLEELTEVPSFEFRQGEMDYIAFSDASAGQQATALLRVLLNQEGPPLVIDQPEEDLDNQVMKEIIEEIWKAKRKRQIIVSSHNANIVVNGDADLVVVCGYRTAGDQSGGKIKCQGAIDIEEINHEITLVMEGGEEAFKLRMDKYGF
ncbi:chromosome segregation protein [Symmachiella dynata]|uniref:TrlF family AAA-like ATPase n=1 Tax=Symmachiella dynata TaxID=2527995 RepID=UPI001189213B|nr:AAA family ATPase [Symmachiella dynata]QDT48924.1 chromosome segregation protein [Symmachiella dynata]